MSDCLDVDRKEFLAGLRLISKAFKAGPAEQALLSFDGAMLYVDVTGISVAMQAKGSWPDQVRIPFKPLLTFIKVPPRQDPLRIVRDQNTVRIDSMTLACEAQQAWKAMIQLTLDPSPIELLALKRTHTLEEILASGLTGRVREAEQAKERAFKKAMESLAKLGMREEDLAAALESAIVRAAGS